jgi:glycosyltransferase 2 family protein
MTNFWKSARRWLPGVIISLGLIAFILYKFDLRNLGQAILSANYWLLLLNLVISVVWLAVRGLAWHTLLRGRASYRDVFLTISEGYLLNNVLPFRLGEVGRAFLLGRKAKLDFMEVLPTIVIERAVDLAFSAAIFLGAIPFVVGASGAGRIAAIILGGLVIVGLVILYVLACNRDWAMKLFDQFTVRWPKLQKTGGNFLAPLFTGLAVLTDGWLFVRFLLWMALDWSISIFQVYLVLLAFFPAPQPVWALFGLGAVAFANAVPSLPGAIGVYEAALGGAIALVSRNQATSLAFALVSHLFGYVVTGIIGGYALSTEGETLTGLYRQLRKRQKE